jgi:non-ribosomal peptide synthase protein (TIGR01720 family)
VLNSVVQYFPDMHYLLGVLERAANTVVDGGRIFIGDVRHFGLLRAFHSSVQLTRAAGEVEAAQLTTRIDAALQHEKELVVDPEFFCSLPQHLPRISRVEVQLKRGSTDNELTRYRYDVTLHLGTHTCRVPHDWFELESRSDLLLELSRVLETNRPPAIRIKGLANARVAKDLRIQRLIEESPGTVQVARLVEQLSLTERESADGAFDPETLCRWGEAQGFEVRALWTRAATDGSFDVEFIDPKRCESISIEAIGNEVAVQRPWNDYVHEPSTQRTERRSVSLAQHLRDYLDGKLPEYMVPSAIVVLNELPLTANGKIDRAKLPLPDFGGSRSQPFATPQGAVEAALAGVWQEVLRVSQVGRNDSFFELGGNSILAIQIAGRANRMGMKVEGRQILESDNIAKLAQQLDSFVPTVAVAQETTPVVGEVPLSPLMRQLVTAVDDAFLYKNILVFRFEAGRRLEPEPFARALRQLAAHHDALRIRFQSAPGGMRLWNAAQEDSQVGELLQTVDLSMLAPATRQQAIQDISSQLLAPSEVDEIRMLRAVLVEGGNGEPQQLLLAVHHVVFDPVTQEILFHDLASAYEQASRGDAIELGIKTTSFKRWAECIADHAMTAAREEESYWRGMLTAESVGLSREPGLPAYFSIESFLDIAQTHTLENIVCRRCEASMEEVLLTALTHAVARNTSARKLAVSLTRSGRDTPFKSLDLSRTIGWFSTEFPVVLDASTVAGVATVKRIARQVRAVPNHGIGYGILRYNRAGNLLSGCAQPRIALNYLGNPRARPDGLLRLAGLDANKFSEDRLADPEAGARLQITADISAGKLRISWAFDERIMNRTAAEALAASYVEALGELIDANEPERHASG